MKNITESDINEIRDFKLNIKNAEMRLDVFMEMDISNSKIRSEIRSMLISISDIESKLSSKLSDLK